jgi:hypothetical protein
VQPEREKKKARKREKKEEEERRADKLLGNLKREIKGVV